MTVPTIQHASHQLCAALHMDGIDPSGIEVHLPHDAWWRLWTRLEQLHPGTMHFDGRGRFVPDHFRYMGVTYRVKEPPKTSKEFDMRPGAVNRIDL